MFLNDSGRKFQIFADSNLKDFIPYMYVVGLTSNLFNLLIDKMHRKGNTFLNYLKYHLNQDIT